jgi:hypothetical protein
MAISCLTIDIGISLEGGREKRKFIELIKKKTKPETRNQASSEKSLTCMSLLHHLVVYQWQNWIRIVELIFLHLSRINTFI